MKNYTLLILAAFALTLLNCSQNSDRDNDTSINSSTDYAFGQAVVYDAFQLVHQAANSSKGISTSNLADTTSLFGCDTILVDTLSNPMSITIKFNGTCGYNGIDRSGSITATFSSKYDALGSITNISFNNYYYRGFLMDNGSISYTYTGLTATAPTFSYTVNNVSIASPTRNMKFSGYQTILITSGNTTTNFNDDHYTITGNASGTAFLGNEFTATIDTDVSLAGNCLWINSGTVTVSPENKNPRILDFGSGCNAIATVSVYGTTQEITIH